MEYQDVLAQVGAGSAHPGGMESTRLWLDTLQLQATDTVLEVGCGTGRSLLEVQRRFGCSATGTDVRQAMVEKARTRARKMGQSARFLKADAHALPFANHSFDLVIAESVHVFCDPERSVAEVFRVLKPGHLAVDVEMMVTEPVTAEWREGVHSTYGVKSVPDWSGWKRIYRAAGFPELRALEMRRVVPDQAMIAEQNYPDPVDLAAPGAYWDRRILSMLEMNAKWLEHNHHALGYVVMTAQKPQA